MKIGKRDINLWFIFDYRHYRSLLNIFRYCQQPVDFLARYFLSLGSYPKAIRIKTPIGLVSPLIYFYDDSLTINEIFFRLDYKMSSSIKVFVDIGSNIGISALYFLTRNNFSKGYLYEPLESNLVKLNNNLANFSDRVKINQQAVYLDDGVQLFNFEATGRLGGINRKLNDTVEVNCIAINNVLENILQTEGFIDVLKIDIEGDELKVVQAIFQKYFSQIGIIYFDIDYTFDLDEKFSVAPLYFTEYRYGNTYVMKNKKL